MRCNRWTVFGLSLGLFSLATLTTGCGNNRVIDDDEPALKPPKIVEVVRKPMTGPNGAALAYDGVLKGKITLDGERPTNKILPGIAQLPACHAPETVDWQNGEQKWIVDDQGGVGNVLVYLLPANATFFDLPENLRTRKDQVVMDQPFCAFVPHVISAFPKYFDGAEKDKDKQYKSSGQDFFIKNSAKIAHNSKWGGNPLKNPGGNPLLAPGDSIKLALEPDDKIGLQCNIHGWMGAFIFTFEHPFHAVTKLDGTFEISNVPTGVPLRVVAWHEGAGYFHGGQTGTETTLQPGENKLDLKAPKR